MANEFLTPTHLSQMVLAHLKNESVLLDHIYIDHSGQFGEVGDTINLRRPQRFDSQVNNLDTSSSGTTDIEDAKVPLVMNQTRTARFTVGALDMALSTSKEHVNERYAKPAAIKLKDDIEAYIGSLYPQIYNFSGTPGTATSTFKHLGAAGAQMTKYAVPLSDRYAFHDPEIAVELADGLKTVFVQDKVRAAIERARIGRYANFENFEAVHVPVHTNGTHTTGSTPVINGASQETTYALSKNTGTQTLVTDGWANSTAVLKAGDAFTLPDVYSVNPISKKSTGVLQTFVVQSDVTSDGSGNATLTIAPPMITSGPFQTVNHAPSDGDALTPVTGTEGATYKQSILCHRDAIALATRGFKVANKGVESRTESNDRFSISVTEWVEGSTLEHTFRFDVLFGAKFIRPDLAHRRTS